MLSKTLNLPIPIAKSSLIKVTLICESDRMIAHLAKCVVDGSQDFILNDKSCNEGDPTVVNQSPCHAAWNINDTTDDGCVTFHTRLDECGTSVRF